MDNADLLANYNHSFIHLQPILFDLSDISASLDNGNEIINPNCVDIVYEKIITALKLCAALAVPLRRKIFFKFWWSQELDCLKDSAIDSDKLWKAAGRTRSGSLYDRRFADKRAYRAAIRKNQRKSDDVFTVAPAPLGTEGHVPPHFQKLLGTEGYN